LRIPALSSGTATLGGGNDFLRAWGSTGVSGAARLIDTCLNHGVTLFDTADIYSDGLGEDILGQAIKGKPDKLLIFTKVTFPFGDGPNDFGSSRQHLIAAVHASLKRLRIDTIDLLQLHGQDFNTPVEETLSTLDQLVREGKIQYIGGSNFSGWHLMKSLAVSGRYGYPRHVLHQVYYSLLNRDYEWDLQPLGTDQGVGALIWSTLGWDKLTGKIRRGQPAKRGHIMNITSVAGYVGFSGSGYYAASKHAVEGLSDALAAEVNPLGIHVTCVALGPFRTDWAGRSLIQTNGDITDYADTAYARMESTAAKTGSQACDPARAAEAMIALTDAKNPPHRIVLGAFGLDAVPKKLRAEIEEIEAWRQSGLDTDFPWP